MKTREYCKEARSRRAYTAVAAALLVQCGALSTAHAFEIESDNPDVKMRWDNTFKYSTAVRTGSRSDALVTDNPAANQNTLNLDDGDRNFKSGGLISSRVDILSEFDLSYKNDFGFRISGAGWSDSVYQRGNSNDAPGRVNQSSVGSNEFTAATRKQMGSNAEILDAFVYANGNIADMPSNVRLGKHSVLYGETLFFGANGIANAQSPVDIVKLLAVPGSQFKELIVPVNQVSGQIQLKDNITLGAYYQFEFVKSRIPASGSFLSTADVFDEGAENFLFAPGIGVPRIADKKAKNAGQYGAQIRWRPANSDAEFGFYAANYHDKVFQAYLRPVAGNFQLAYPEDIKTYGASVSTTLGDLNVAGEVSVRMNTPLVSGPLLDLSPTGSGGIGDNALYAVGNSAHLNLSAIYLLKPNSIWQGGSLLGEFAWNTRTAITKNAAALDPNTTRDAYGFRFIFEPSWFQVLPQMDISVPIGLGYNPKGASSVVQQFNGGVDKGGDVSIGIKGTYAQKWRFGVNYTHFFGSEGAALGADAHLTFKQSLADRDNISFSIQRTF